MKLRGFTNVVRDATDRLKGPAARIPPPETTEKHLIKLTSETVTDGRYPAKRYDYDGDTGTATEKESCWVRAVNGEPLIVGPYWWMKLVGSDSDDGRDIYALTGPAFVYRYICGDAPPGGGGGSSGSFDCSGQADPLLPNLTATVTNKVGCFTGMPDSFTFVGGEILWTADTPDFACGGGCTYAAWEIASTTMNLGASTTGGCAGPGFWAPEAGGICDPVVAVYLVDDGAGNTCTITVAE